MVLKGAWKEAWLPGWEREAGENTLKLAEDLTGWERKGNKIGGASSPRPQGAATLGKYLAPQEMATLVSALSKALPRWTALNSPQLTGPAGDI